MKLKDGFVLHQTGGEYMMVATGDATASFNGLVRNNQTSNFILTKLLEDTTEEAIVDAMVKAYDAPKDVIQNDVHQIILKLKEAGFIDE